MPFIIITIIAIMIPKDTWEVWIPTLIHPIIWLINNTFIIITIIAIIIADFMDFKIELFLIYGWGKWDIGIFFKTFYNRNPRTAYV